MVFYTKEFNPEKHHGMLCEWWTEWKWPAVPVSLLPKNGIVVYEEETPVCAGFMYLTDSDWGIMEWIVGNPWVSKEERHNGLDCLIQDLILVAKSNAKKAIFSSVNHPSLIDAYSRNGMIVTDKGMTNFVWRAK